jgi:hypothetical protein
MFNVCNISANEVLLNWFSLHFKRVVIFEDQYLVYKGQVPNIAVLVIEGELEVYQKSKTTMRITEPTLVAVKELFLSEEINVDICLKSGSKVIFINRNLVLRKRLKEIYKNS